MKSTVYLAYHKPAPLIEGPSLTPIHVGRADAAPFLGLIGDDTGDNISARNPFYCELTALYWIWKNDTTSDFKGLMHYRRLLDFQGEYPSGSAETFIGELHLPRWTADAESWINTHIESYDIVVPRKHTMGKSVSDNYASAHQTADFDLAREAIQSNYPDYLESFDRVARESSIRLGNIAIMRAGIFDRYCAWLFDILAHVEAADVDRSRYNSYQRRFIGFLAERLLTVFIEHELHSNPDLKLHETSILNLSGAVITPYSTDPALNAPDQVNIAFSADRTYLPHTAAMLRSLLDHADPKRQLNLFFLHSEISPQDLQILETMLTGHDNVSLSAINVGRRFNNSYRSASRAPSNATYNRFLLFDLLPDVEKLLYIDVDIIVRRDICALYDTEMGNAKIAGVTDWIMTRTLTGKVSTIDPDVPDLYKYQRERLGLQDQHIERYFNAGVLLFNFKAMDDIAKVSSELMARVDAGGMLFRDQDILNAYFKDDLLLLDPRWNVFNSLLEAYAKVPFENHQKAMAARAEPWLIHYADGTYKPWRATAVPMAEHYWQALSRTPFFGEVICGLDEKAGRAHHSRSRSPLLVIGRKLIDRVPILRKPLLKGYSLFRKLTSR